jgi:N-acetylmuramic acid 6-phosphate etherase
MVLNMISTGAMARLGYVYGTFMVNVWTKNEKLVDRAVRIIQQATGSNDETARHALRASGNRTPLALVMLAANVSRKQAAAALKETNGHVRQAIAKARN